VFLARRDAPKPIVPNYQAYQQLRSRLTHFGRIASHDTPKTDATHTEAKPFNKMTYD
jgi:hypothetical protein